ncbi:MAG: Ig-like domain repeat protein [Aquihabitans sp.]
MRRSPNRTERPRRVRTWAGVLVAVGAAAAFLAPAAPAGAAVLPATSTDLVLDRSQAMPGDPVLLTATVTPTGAPGTTPTGTVTFKRGSVTLGTTPLDEGTAVLTLTTFPVGTHAITAAYSGSPALRTSTSPARSLVVAKGPSTTTVTAPADALPGEATPLSAIVAGPDAAHPATGTVVFKRGTSTIGSAPVVDGVASLAAVLPAGVLSITAAYQGSAGLAPSVSAATTTTVAKAATATALQVDASLAGAPATLTATVTTVGVERIPTGKIVFRRGTTSVGVADLDGSGQARLVAALPAGPLSLTATYAGTASLAGSVSAATPIDLAKASTTTALTIEPSGFAVATTPVTLTATTTVVDGRTATGSVTFKRGTATIASTTLVNGTATLTAVIPVGSHAITATYNGSATVLGSTSAPSALTVAKLDSAIAVHSPSDAVFGEPAVLSASVSVPGDARIATGTVTFLRGATTIGSAPLDGTGTAQLVTQTLPVGSQTITARYNGSSALNGAASLSTTTTVSKAVTAVSMDSFTPAAASGDPVALRAAVAALAPSTAVPTGRVTFRSGATSLGSVTVGGGVAELTTTVMPVGATTVTASYAGNASFLPSSVTFQSVLAAPTDVAASPGRGSAVVSFTPPVTDGGSPITSFIVTATDQTDPGAPEVTVTDAWPGIEIGGLTPGHVYLVVVRAENAAGATANSTASDPVIPLALCPSVDGSTERSDAGPGVDWSGCDLSTADLHALDLTGANLTGARLTGADLAGADLDGVQLSGASISGVRSGSISGTPASLPSNSDLVNGYLVGGGASLRDAMLPGADLADKLIGGSDWTRADVHGANLRGAFMGYIVLQDANLADADLHGAYVLLANLRHADLRGADLTQAHLGGSDLTGADLTDANLAGADLSSPPPYPQINLTGAVFCRTTMPSGEINNSGCPV